MLTYSWRLACSLLSWNMTMCKSLNIVLLSVCALTARAETVFIECEAFDDLGGWVNDTQFMDQMGSPYLLAHGLGKPVADAKTTFVVRKAGTYDVRVRTKNWTAPWHSGVGAGTFNLIVNGRTLQDLLGVQGKGEWLWVKVDSVKLERNKTNTVALHDCDGFDGRCDAIVFTTDFHPNFNRTIPQSEQSNNSYDLCVVGAGIGGICTAVSAARLGLKVALVHDRPVLGGNNSSEVRVHLGAWQNMLPYPRLGDVLAEFGPPPCGNADPAACYGDDRKLAIVENEKNIDLFLCRRVNRVITNEVGAITSVGGVDTRHGDVLWVKARWFADCTGDGAVGFLAGADYRMGREAKSETGEPWAPENPDMMTMGASVQWRAKTVGNSEGGKVRCEFPVKDWMVRLDDASGRAEMKGDWDWEAGIGRDQIAEAERIRDYGLLVAYSNWAYAKNVSKKQNEFKNAELEWVAYNAGRRESRRLMGDFVLSENDILSKKLQPDGTCATTWTIDLHLPKTVEESGFSGEPFRANSENEKIWPYPVPYRCFYSRNVPNLFMAGRNISVTHIALGTTRLMRTIGMMGEVVGMAASLCKLHGCNPRDIYAKHLDELKALMTKGVGDGRPHPPQMYNIQASLDPAFNDGMKENCQLRARGASVVAPYGCFADGLLAKTTPRGWIRTFCERQRSGLTGHPEALSYPYDGCLWAGEIARSGTHGSGWWRYEQTAYYTDGLLKLGYALDDKELIAKGVAGVDYTFDHVSPEGYLGSPVIWDARCQSVDKGNVTWPMAVFFRAIKARYEATPDERIPAALRRYYLKYGVATLARHRNLASIEGILWTYAHTGDRRLLTLAEEAWCRAAPSGHLNADALNPATCLSAKPLYVHGVTYCETMKVPMILAAYTGKREYLEQAINVERKLVRDHLLPDGCPSSVEQTRGNSVHWGHETCDIADFTWSVGYALETTGDGRYADEIERCVFNAAPGAVTKDFKALQYFSNLNQFIATGRSNQNPYCHGSTWQQYRPTHETECCAGSVHRIMPNYISRMWLKNREGDPVAALYGPSEVDYGFVRIREETEYPFEGHIRFVFEMPEARVFTFGFRVPGWCVAGASARVNGQSVELPAPGRFGSVRQKFHDGDVVELDFPMEVRFESVAPRTYVVKDSLTGETLSLEGRLGSQGTVVVRGPVVYAYPIETATSVDNEEYSNLRGKKSANPEFPCLDMRPAGPFSFALAAHESRILMRTEGGYAFDAEATPVTIEVPVRRIEWALEAERYTPDMPKSVVPVACTNEVIRLVPYGATCLRLAVFPELNERYR